MIVLHGIVVVGLTVGIWLAERREKRPEEAEDVKSEVETH